MKKQIELKIDLETVKNLLKTGASFKDLIEQEGFDVEEIMRRKEKKSWDDIDKPKGWIFSNNFTYISQKWSRPNKSSISSSPLFISEKDCNTALAISKLGWLIDYYNEGKSVDWKDTGIPKFVIVRKFGGDKNFIVRSATYEYCYLAFLSREVAEMFLKDQINIIKEYYEV